MGGQKLCQILASALLATQWFLSFQDKKFIRLTTLLTTVLINWHISSFTVTDAKVLPVYIATYSFRRPILVPTSSLMSLACIVYGKLLKLALT